VLAAAPRAIRLIDEDVVVAGGADYAVNCLVKLLVPASRGVLAAALLARHCHRMVVAIIISGGDCNCSCCSPPSAGLALKSPMKTSRQTTSYGRRTQKAASSAWR